VAKWCKTKAEELKMTGRRDSDVIIIGGGATGAGIARDCARRGLNAAH
jgi:glycerol-3-phosphate dehydrogenase